jgi:putative pyruvate formate lyase activating enzyme
MDYTPFLTPLEELNDCSFCPRNCHADRFSGKLGYCKSDASFNISSICIHHGEEPVISGKNGICNIFFTNCNLQCIYCQNWQISVNRKNRESTEMSLDQVIHEITSILDSGIDMIGFFLQHM